VEMLNEGKFQYSLTDIQTAWKDYRARELLGFDYRDDKEWAQILAQYDFVFSEDLRQLSPIDFVHKSGLDPKLNELLPNLRDAVSQYSGERGF
ncbi:MAG: hypothetical protein KDD42_08020, partial [Bdellovibrionales bacterium]|nr:hypothetical protein [Bdellovibrionales bacterium]